MSFDQREKAILSSIGQNTHGNVLVGIMKRRRDELSDTDTIPTNANYGAEVEGRKLFKKWAKEFIDALSQKQTQRSPDDIDEDDFT